MSQRREYRINLTDFQLRILRDGIKELRAQRDCDAVSKSEYKNILTSIERAEYLNRKENNSAICLMYEAFIYFLLQEDYKKCGYIRSLLNSYSNFRFQKY